MFATIATLLIVAQTPAAVDPAPLAAKPVSEKAEKICRSVKGTGSRLGSRRVCKTQADWDDEAAAMQRETKGRMTPNAGG